MKRCLLHLRHLGPHKCREIQPVDVAQRHCRPAFSPLRVARTLARSHSPRPFISHTTPASPGTHSQGQTLDRQALNKNPGQENQEHHQDRAQIKGTGEGNNARTTKDGLDRLLEPLDQDHLSRTESLHRLNTLDQNHPIRVARSGPPDPSHWITTAYHDPNQLIGNTLLSDSKSIDQRYPSQLIRITRSHYLD